MFSLFEAIMSAILVELVKHIGFFRKYRLVDKYFFIPSSRFIERTWKSRELLIPENETARSLTPCIAGADKMAIAKAINSRGALRNSPKRHYSVGEYHFERRFTPVSLLNAQSQSEHLRNACSEFGRTLLKKFPQIDMFCFLYKESNRLALDNFIWAFSRLVYPSCRLITKKKKIARLTESIPQEAGHSEIPSHLMVGRFCLSMQ